MEEAQVLYFARQDEGQWTYRALPISKTHLDSIPPSAPGPHEVQYSDDWDFLGKLIDELRKLLAASGALKGWKIHLLEEPLVINGYYQSKVIITRIVPEYQA